MRTPFVCSVVASCCLLVGVSTSAETRPLNGIGSGASATSARCIDLIKECFAYDSNEKTSCFHVSSKHPFCTGTDLGLLAGKRWTMSPQTDFRDAAPALTGPQFIDGDCVANVDSQWSGHLIGGTLTREAIRQLDAALDGCAKAPANEIFRP